MLDRLPKQYHEFLLSFDPEIAEQSPDSGWYYRRMELISGEDKSEMGPIDHWSQDEEKILVQCFQKLIKE